MATTLDTVISDPEQRATLAFLSIRGVGPSACQKLSAEFGSLAEALEAGPARYLPLLRGDAQRDHNEGTEPLARAEEAVVACEKLDAQILFPGDSSWPAALKELGQAEPRLLFVRGTLNQSLRRVGVVGTRLPTAEGMKIAESLGKTLALNGLVTISGGAAGIDTSAHRGALVANGVTWAILGAGFHHPFPEINQELFESIVEHGALLTEFAPAHEIKKGNFPRRNLIVAALSQPLVVVQGDVGSGALITARAAQKLGRTIMPVPGRVFDEKSAGPNLLLREGKPNVRACGHSSDVLHFLGIQHELEGADRKKRPGEDIDDELHLLPDAPLDASLEPVYRALNGQPKHLDELAGQMQWPTSKLLAALTELELKGWAVQQPGKLFLRRSG